MYYIYRFLDNNQNVLYIGKSVNVYKRINQHFGGEGHLPEECYMNCSSIEIIEYENPLEMDIGEIFFINKYKPKYNTISKYDANYKLDITINEDWKFLDFEMNKIKYNYLKFKESSLKIIIDELKELKKEQMVLGEKISNIEKTLEKYSNYNIIIPKLNEINKIDENEYKHFEQVLKNLYYMVLDENNDNKVYKKVSENNLMIDLGLIWDDLSKGSELTKNNFLKLCKKVDLLKGDSNEYYKNVRINFKVKKCYKINLDDLEKLI